MKLGSQVKNCTKYNLLGTYKTAGKEDAHAQSRRKYFI
jgi:hypothetical protein